MRSGYERLPGPAFPMSAAQTPDLPKGLQTPPAARYTKNPHSRYRYGARKAFRFRLANVEESLNHPTAAARLRGCESLRPLIVKFGDDTHQLYDAADPRGPAPIVRKLSCNHRLCECCMAHIADRKRRQLERVIAERWPKRRPLLLTLTQKDRQGEPLADALQRFQDRWSRFSSSATWRHHVRGAVLGTEATWSTPETRAKAAARNGTGTPVEDTGCWWHVHAHAVIDVAPCDRKACWECVERAGDRRYSLIGNPKTADERADLYASVDFRADLRAQLAEAKAAAKAAPCDDTRREVKRLARLAETCSQQMKAWECDTTRRGHVLHQKAILLAWRRGQDDEKDGGANIQRVRSGGENGRGLGEAVKYPIKGMDARRLDDDQLRELLRATTGRRMVRTYGNLRDLKLEDDDDEKPLAPEQVAQLGPAPDAPVLPWLIDPVVDFRTGNSHIRPMPQELLDFYGSRVDHDLPRPFWTSEKRPQTDAREALYQAWWGQKRRRQPANPTRGT